MYIIHLVLTRLIGLVSSCLSTYNKSQKEIMAVLLSLEWLPPLPGKSNSDLPQISAGCSAMFMHDVDYRFLRDIFIPKHYKSGKSRRFFEDVPCFRIVKRYVMPSCPKRSLAPTYCNGNGCAYVSPLPLSQKKTQISFPYTKTKTYLNL